MLVYLIIVQMTMSAASFAPPVTCAVNGRSLLLLMFAMFVQAVVDWLRTPGISYYIVVLASFTLFIYL